MLIHADNFSHYGGSISYMTSGIYSRVGTSKNVGGNTFLTNDPDGVSSGKVLEMTATYGGNSNYQTCRYVLPAGATATVGACFRFWCPALPSVALSMRPIQFLDAGTNILYFLNVTSTGILEIRNASGVLQYATSAPVITAQGWWHIAIQATMDASVGAWEVRVEDIPVISQTGLNTGSTLISQVEIVNDPDATSNSDPYYIKDFVIWDDTGSENNTFLGSVLVEELVPSSDVILPWATTGVDGASVLANDPPNASQYISAAYPAMPAAAKFNMTDLPANITSVKGLITLVRAAKSDGGDGKIQVSLISGSSTDSGADRTITTTQTYFTDVSELDPATGTAWTPTSADAAV